MSYFPDEKIFPVNIEYIFTTGIYTDVQSINLPWWSQIYCDESKNSLFLLKAINNTVLVRLILCFSYEKPAEN